MLLMNQQLSKTKKQPEVSCKVFAEDITAITVSTDSSKKSWEDFTYIKTVMQSTFCFQNIKLHSCSPQYLVSFEESSVTQFY